MPPLSWTLRDSPPPIRLPDPAAVYSFGERPGATTWLAAFQSALPPAVLLPESFRGGCSFGAAPFGRDLSCGRAYGKPSLPLLAGGGQPLSPADAFRGTPGSAPPEMFVELDDVGRLLKTDDYIEVAGRSTAERDCLIDVVGDPGASRPRRDRYADRE